MIRVYLDWNIFSYLKKYKTSKQPFITLNENLTKNKEKLLIPYSSAHLTDLIKSYNQSAKGKLETIDDLQYLEELTNNYCILYDYKKQDTYPDVYNIQEYFEYLLESDTLYSGNFEDLFSSFKGSGMDGLFNSYLNLLKIIPSGIEANTIEKIPPKFVALKNSFQNTLNDNSYYNLLTDTFKLICDYNTNPKTYRSIRNASLEELRLTNDYTESKNPIEDISKNLEASVIRKTFKEFADQMSAHLKDKSQSRFTAFTNYYILLDFLGYYRDKEFKNLLQDSFHAFYGAHCDFFVTDDDNTYHKAKVIYEHFNIETIVCKSDAFNTKFYGKVILNDTFEKPLFDVISDTLNSSFVLTNQHDDKFNPVDIYKVDHYILNYFNRLQVTYNVDGTKSIHIYKNSKNYSSFYFFKEVEVITNRICKELGTDKNNRLVYNPETENTELRENKWEGRAWEFDSSAVELDMREAPFGLTLSINLLGSKDKKLL